MAKFQVDIEVEDHNLGRALDVLDGIAHWSMPRLIRDNPIVASVEADGLMSIPLPKSKTKFTASEFADTVEKAGFSKHSTYYALQQLVKLKRISKTKKRGTYVVR